MATRRADGWHFRRFCRSRRRQDIAGQRDVHRFRGCRGLLPSTRGKVEESQVQLARNMISSLKDNYDRLAYIVYLFNLPNDPRSRKNKERDQLRLKNYFSRVKADGDSIEFENKDVLEHLKEFLKENGYYE